MINENQCHPFLGYTFLYINMSKRIFGSNMPRGAFRKYMSSQMSYFVGMGAITLVTCYFFGKNSQMMTKVSSHGGLVTSDTTKKATTQGPNLEQVAKELLSQNLEEIEKDYVMVPIARPQAGSDNDSRVY